jgi:5-aminolevulinate synthase
MGLRTGREWCQAWRGRIAVAGQLDLAAAAGG